VIVASRRFRAWLALCLFWASVFSAPLASGATAPAAGAPRAGTRTAPRPPAKKPAVKPATKPAVKATANPVEKAMEARSMEDLGAYTKAAEALRELRKGRPLDPDLELALALNEARAGQLDSADVRLHGRLLSAAAFDTLDSRAWAEYPVDRERTWFDGRFEGWHWYVWRARLEIAARRGRWDEALEAALQCAHWRANSGKEWAMLAVCAAHTGKDDVSRNAADEALRLDPSLPEASYLAGLWSERTGNRTRAQSLFRQAAKLDSSYRDAALAWVRSRLPMAPRDSFPTELLNGERRAGLITSAARPKLEDEIHVDVGAAPDHVVNPLHGDSLRAGTKPVRLTVSLLVNQQGRVVLNDLPWYSFAQLPAEKVARWLTAVPEWTFQPAVRNGSPVAVWVSLDVQVNP
jgi:tetratricopeptide (TPR) repeat protein